MMKPLIIYHADCTDGYGAAFAAWLKFGDDADYFPAHYGKCETPDAMANYLPEYQFRPVYVIDFSFPRSVMEVLMREASSLIWLDHHATSFRDWCGATYLDKNDKYASSVVIAGELAPRILVELDNCRSGALIAWHHFHPEKPVPRLFAHIDDYDRWVFRLPNTKEISLALSSYAPWSFEQWSDMVVSLGTAEERETPMYQLVIAEGQALLRMQEALVRSVMVDAVPCLLPGCDTPGLAVTCPMLLANDVGAALAQQCGTYAMCWYQRGDGSLKVSLRSAGTVDVSRIAEVQGGGGHPGAAGFTTQPRQLGQWLSPYR